MWFFSTKYDFYLMNGNSLSVNGTTNELYLVKLLVANSVRLNICFLTHYQSIGISSSFLCDRTKLLIGIVYKSIFCHLLLKHLVVAPGFSIKMKCKVIPQSAKICYHIPSARRGCSGLSTFLISMSLKFCED